jgi:hypothetical protein
MRIFNPKGVHIFIFSLCMYVCIVVETIDENWLKCKYVMYLSLALGDDLKSISGCPSGHDTKAVYSSNWVC